MSPVYNCSPPDHGSAWEMFLIILWLLLTVDGPVCCVDMITRLPQFLHWYYICLVFIYIWGTYLPADGFSLPLKKSLKIPFILDWYYKQVVSTWNWDECPHHILLTGDFKDINLAFESCSIETLLKVSMLKLRNPNDNMIRGCFLII